MTKIKICGLTRPEDIQAVNRFVPDYAGFVFAPSKRQVTEEQAKYLSSLLIPAICPAGVFVNAEENFICRLADQGIIRAVQLHGQEPPEYVHRLKQLLDSPDVPVIKAVSMTSGSSLDQWFSSEADYLLLDAGSGGTGREFDHTLIPQSGALSKPWFLAGGMSPQSAPAAIVLYHPFGVDVSSGVETDGKKDAEKIRLMIEAVRCTSEKTAKPLENSAVSAYNTSVNQ